MTMTPQAPEIKVCGITRMADVDAALALGADYLGINVYQGSPRAVDTATARELLNRIPAGKRVMVDVNTGTDVLEDWADLGFDYFQIHCDVDLPIVSVASWAGIVGQDQLWLAPRIPPDEAFPQVALEFASTILVDAYSKDKYGGSGKTGDWERFVDWATLFQHKKWILAGGLSPENVDDALVATSAAVIDVNSGVEEAPGVKDPERLAAFFKAAGRQ